MFTRIVKMEFKPDQVEAFLTNFNLVKTQIRTFPGCQHLALLQDREQPNIFFTYSYWSQPEDLQAYRNSPLFKEVWAFTKTLFNAKPEAWSVDTKYQLN